MNFVKPKVGSNILPISTLCYYHSFKPFIPPHFSIENQDMCHGTTACGLIEIQSQLDQNHGTLYIANEVLTGNRRLSNNISKSFEWKHPQPYKASKPKYVRWMRGASNIPYVIIF